MPPCWGLPQAGSARQGWGAPGLGAGDTPRLVVLAPGERSWAAGAGAEGVRVCVREEGKKCCLCRCALSVRCAPELVCDAGCAVAVCVRAHLRVHVCARASPTPTSWCMSVCLQVRSMHRHRCDAARAAECASTHACVMLGTLGVCAPCMHVCTSPRVINSVMGRCE